MNKKVLLSSIVASSLAVALMIAPKGSQNTTSIGLRNGEALSSSIYRVDGKTISIILPPNNSYTLTKKDLINLLVKYCHTKVSKVYKMNGEEVLKETDTIGTGYLVELESKSKVEVVIYGDVNGDGIIDTNDTITVAKYNVSNASIKSTAQLKAATLVKKESGINTIDTGDTVRIAYYNVGSSKYGKEIVDAEIYSSDESNIVFDLNEIDVKNLKADETIVPEAKEENEEKSNDKNIEKDKQVLEPEVTEPETETAKPETEKPEVTEQEITESEATEPDETESQANETIEEKQEEVNPQNEELADEQPEVNNFYEKSEVPQKHEHTYTNWKTTVEPTCMQKGERVRECTECGETEKEVIVNPNAHKTIKLNDVPATCERYGKENFAKCEYCNAEFFNVVQALGHDYSEEYTIDRAPTCVASGTESRHCVHDGCESIIDSRKVEATGHDLITEVKEATCTEKEITTQKCSKCSYSIIKETAEATGHKFGEYRKNNDATCTIDGTKTAVCTVCGLEDKVVDEGSKKGHNYVSMDNGIQPTCVANGKEADKECLNCGNHINGKTINSTGHEFLLKALSLEEANDEGIECTHCHLKVTADDIISGKGHKWNEQFTLCECDECKEACQKEEDGVWWKTWKKAMESQDENTKKHLLASCIWFVGFKANTTQCNGFYDDISGRNVDHIIVGRRGDTRTITMNKPTAYDNYEFDGWYDLSDGKGKKVEGTSKEEDKTYVDENGNLVVCWKDMDKVFEARFKEGKQY